MCLSGCGGRKRAPDLLELGIQMVVPLCVAVGIKPRTPGREPPVHLTISQPQPILLALSKFNFIGTSFIENQGKTPAWNVPCQLPTESCLTVGQPVADDLFDII